MESKIFQSIGFKHEPVAMILTNVKPEGARQFKEGKWGCIMFLLAATARGETAAFDRQTKAEKPRAVLGLSDISARVAIKRLLKDDLMSFATPFRLFQEMEANVPGSFLERNTWKNLMALRKEGVKP